VRYLTRRFARHWRLTAATGAALAAIGGILSAPAAGASAPAAAGAAGTATATHSFGINQKQARQKSILLINGDRLVLNGKSAQVALAGGGFSAALMELRIGGREYDIPDAALPYLGRGLDLSLFNVAALPQATVNGQAVLPVRIAFTGRTPRLPGVTVTSVSAAGAAGRVAGGYLTAAGAKAFGAALARQFAADHATASYGSDGLFAGGTTVSLPGVAGGGSRLAGAGGGTKSPSAPRFTMHTVTVDGVTSKGRPDTGDVVFLYNSVNNAIYGDPYEDPGFFYHGTARFSLPAGNYYALAFFADTNKAGFPTSFRAVLLPRIGVPGSSTIRVRAASATDELTFTAPHAPTLLASVVQLLFNDKRGDGNAFALFQGPGFPVWLSPTTTRLAAGTLREFVNAWLQSPPSAQPVPDSAPDLYAAEFEDDSGLIRSQHFTLPATSLATVHAVYASDVDTTGAVALSGFTTTELTVAGTVGLFVAEPVPARVTEYLDAQPGMHWMNAYYQSYQALGGGQTDIVRAFTPGSVQTQDWNVYPLHTPLDSSPAAGLGAAAGFFFATPVSVTRAGKYLTINVTPFTDDAAGHTGTGFLQGAFKNIGAIAGNFVIDVNGAQVSAGKITPDTSFGPFFDQLPLPAAPSTVSLTLRARRAGALFPLSTAVSDTWAWTSGGAPTQVPPAGWFCADGSPKCAVEPLLTFGYQVANLSLDGTVAAGQQQVTLSVGHQALTKSPAAITTVTAAFSLDNGATWQPAAVSGSGAARTLSFYAPAGRFVTLKVSAKDAAGGALTETVDKAFATQTLAAATLSAATLSTAKGAADQAHAASLTALVTTGLVTAARAGSGSGPGPDSAAGTPGARYRPACAAPGPGQARCFVLYAPEPGGASGAGTAAAGAAGAPARQPAGLGGRDIERAYKLPVSRHSRATVAVVEAFDTPKLETYLNDYRREYGLGPCTTANGCFRKVGQSGSAKHLPANGVLSGWDLEATLDVDMVSAACPSCKILVVEANSPDFSPLAAAENTAVRLGAAVVSNSYGARENGLELAYAKAYEHRGHVIVASTGDYGYTAASFPAILPNVTAAGGTELSVAKNKRGWHETAWNSPGEGAGSSGCSAYVAKPSWQHDKRCPGRTVADVSAVALNLAIYDKDWGGWGLVGGTSASAPLIAGVYGLAGNAATVKPGYEYAHARALYDVVSGNNDWFFGGNGSSCGNDYLCVAKPGYDAPTGLGTPDGTGAF
jgi:hypothetical protein